MLPVSFRNRRLSILPVIALALTLMAGDAHAITRDDAITLIETTIIDASTYKEVLDGFSFQDPLPPGAVITDNFADTLVVASDTAYFFWLNESPEKEFAHTTYYLLVNKNTGLIDYYGEGKFWPGVDSLLYYLNEADRTGSPDLFWTGGSSIPKNKRPQRRSLGHRPPDDKEWVPDQTRIEHFKATDTWGVIVCTEDTSANVNYKQNVLCAKETFDSLDVDATTVIVNKSKANTLTALDGLPDNCDKLYVYWTGHGVEDSLTFPGGSKLSAKEFACKLKEQNAKEYCVILQFCHSGSVLDELADKGVNGFHMASTSDTTLSTYMKKSTGGPFDGSIFSHYLWDCLQGDQSGVDAYEWADSLTRALIDSLTSSPDSTRWKKNWTGKYENDDHAQGSYVHVFGSGGVGTAGVGEPFCFTLARKCSTGCIRIPGNTNSDTCSNFTLACEAVSGTDTMWTKIGGYNWNKGKTIYWRTFGAPGATGKYKMTMHSNKGGTRAEVTWLPGTSTPVTTPNTTVFNSYSLGWSDEASYGFNSSLGSGVGGPYFFAWQDGASYADFPANLGPGWYDAASIEFPIDVDPLRPHLYIGEDPLNGFIENTMVVVDPLYTYDPLNPTQPDIVEWQLQAFGAFSGNFYGPFNGTIIPSGSPQPFPTPPFLVDLGTILPEPLIVDLDVFGPGVLVIDAIMLAPQEAVPCLSQFSTMHVAGDFNGFDIGGPPMEQIGPCLWRQEMPVLAGCYYMKFITDGNFDNPPDYGGCFPEDPTCSQPLGGQACLVSGFGTALGQIDFPADDVYEFLLDESTGNFTITPLNVTGAPEDRPATPSRFALHGNSPNPFNPTTRIKYDLPRTSPVTVTVFSLAGRQVSILEQNRAKPAGHYEVIWDGKDKSGKAVGSGLYFYRIDAGSFHDTKRMVLIR